MTRPFPRRMTLVLCSMLLASAAARAIDFEHGVIINDFDGPNKWTFIKFEHGVNLPDFDWVMGSDIKQASFPEERNEFAIWDWDDHGPDVPVFTIMRGAEYNALKIGPKGVGIGLADGTSPINKLDIMGSDTNPAAIRLRYPSGNTFSLSHKSTGGLSILNGISSEAIPFQVGSRARAGIKIDTGGVGVGMKNGAPTATLHVKDEDTARTSSILVENDRAFDTDQAMFRLRNPGQAKVRFAITTGAGGSAPSTWTFDNSYRNKEFSISLVGTGKNEFALKANGDGTFRGKSFATQHVNTSSRVAKTAFSQIDQKDILEGVLSLPVTQWRYKTEEPDEMHIGPVAEDFQATFGLGDGKTISTVDTSGIAFAAIQGLKQSQDDELSNVRAEVKTILQEKDAEIATLRASLDAQRESLAAQEERMVQLEIALTQLVQAQAGNLQLGASH